MQDQMKAVYNILLEDHDNSYVFQHYLDKDENGLIVELERFDPSAYTTNPPFQYREEYFIAY